MPYATLTFGKTYSIRLPTGVLTFNLNEPAQVSAELADVLGQQQNYDRWGRYVECFEITEGNPNARQSKRATGKGAKSGRRRTSAATNAVELGGVGVRR